ncbi:hypothetical protein AVEN_236389-1 [Araneus ventricosus]|uniref:Uncharacterized protein n=1 Tax=Araneus ventricosus TaxID=182803 RepID=A0A4Y2LUX7_ARAVE|nr:hypothetical protein AVEN_236389-1 [Araneus ventricosus]
MERRVKADTEASSKVCESAAQAGYVRARIVNKTNTQAFESKADYKPAIDYSELIDWTKCGLLSPPMMESLTTESISSVLQNKSLPEFDFLNFPCHTQIVEICVKLVTESAEKVCGQGSKDGYIVETLFSTSTMPQI